MTKHGMTGSKIHGVWASMIQRCYNEKSDSFEYYGGRGITVAAEWLVFENFMADMLPTYKPGLSIERIDVNGNYEKSNCKWIPMSEQPKNTRRTAKAEMRKQILKEIRPERSDHSGSDLLKASQVADLLGEGWSRQRVHVELKRGTIIDPAMWAGKTPLWTAAQVEQIKQQKGIE